MSAVLGIMSVLVHSIPVEQLAVEVLQGSCVPENAVLTSCSNNQQWIQTLCTICGLILKHPFDCNTYLLVCFVPSQGHWEISAPVIPPARRRSRKPVMIRQVASPPAHLHFTWQVASTPAHLHFMCCLPQQVITRLSIARKCDKDFKPYWQMNLPCQIDWSSSLKHLMRPITRLVRIVTEAISNARHRDLKGCREKGFLFCRRWLSLQTRSSL